MSNRNISHKEILSILLNSDEEGGEISSEEEYDILPIRLLICQL